MASKNRSHNGRRDNPTPAPLSLAPLPFLISQSGLKVAPNPTYKQPAQEINYDRRRFNPTKTVSSPTYRNRDAARIRIANTYLQYAKARTFTRSLFVRLDPLYGRKLEHRLAFNIPKRLEMCIRRAARREVMHAKKKAGKRGQKRPNRNFWSNISCRR